MYNNNLKDAREELEMTQVELGNQFNVTRNTVSGWENARDTMPFEKLVKFCNLYNFSLDYIVGFTNRNIRYNNLINISKEEMGINLKKLRKKLNLTQVKLAKECGISQTTYSHYERGELLINTITIYSICKTYNISIDYLCNRCDKMFF